MSSTFSSTKPSYVLVTPARNEAAFIELTIQSVISQAHRPVKWVIVSDGSTDGTDEIVKKYLTEHPWIELVRRPERAERHFAGKVIAFNDGYVRVKELNYDLIGNLDADITFEPNYFEFLTMKFAENPRLGVGGTPFREGDQQYNYNFTSIEHVSGACQLFRRECFEDIGGYTPIKGGGIDLVAVTTARMKGWQTRSFPEKTCIHHRVMGTATQSKLGFFLKGGRRDYVLGVHPLWELFRSIYQMSKQPYVLGGLSLFWGFFSAMASGAEMNVSKELVEFRRKEQMGRLRNFFRKSLRQPPSPA
jgi:glycosyltransferase involved in cell wall biosynthesis